MNTVATKNFGIKPLVAAVALAFAPIAVQAAPTPLQMPGAGVVTAVAGASTVNGFTTGGKVVNLVTGATLTLAGAPDPRVVIQWGGPGAPVFGVDETKNPPGFNIGAAATLNVETVLGGGIGSLLNIDASGSMSQIYGTLNAGFNGGNAGFTQVFIANANGIVVAPTGRIVAPYGMGLIGADLGNTSTGTAVYDFVRNNAAATSYLDVRGGTAPVVVQGTISGDLVQNHTAGYVLLVGSDVTNTGNIFGGEVNVLAGLGAVGTTATVNGSSATVHRLYTLDFGLGCPSGHCWGDLAVNGNLGSAGGVRLSGVGGSFSNTGSISSSGDPGYTAFSQTSSGRMHIWAAKNITTGTSGSTNQAVGLFSDGGIQMDTYDSGLTGIYNVVEAYTFGSTLPFLDVNRQSGWGGDVTVRAIIEGSNPSTILTSGDVWIRGNNVLIDSTINHTLGTVNNGNLTIIGTNSVTISKDVGAAEQVRITSGGPLLISGNVLSDTDQFGDGRIEITNTGAGAPTTISGNVHSLSTGTSSTVDGIGITVDGPLTISGNVTALNTAKSDGSFIDILNNSKADATGISGDVTAWHHVDITTNADLSISGDTKSFVSNVDITNLGAGATTDISGMVNAGNDVNVDVRGMLDISGNVHADDNVNIANTGTAVANTTTISGDVDAGNSINILNTPFVTGNLNISGTLTAGNDVTLLSAGNLELATVTAGDNIGIGVFGLSSKLSGPMTAGGEFLYTAPLATTKLLPEAVIKAPHVELDNVLNFVGVNDSWNAYIDASQKPDFQIMTNLLDVHIQGTINAPIAGNTNWVTNSMVVTPITPLAPVFASVWADGGGFQAINLKFLGDAFVDSWNTTTPFINVPLTTGAFPAGGLQGNAGSSMILNATGALIIAPGSDGVFQFPGGLAFLAGTLLDIHTPVYNAFTTNAVPFQGVWGEVAAGGTINATSFFATNGNAWVNFSQRPTTAPAFSGPTVYRIQSVGSPVPTMFGFVDQSAEALHQNVYTTAILGVPVNTCPVSVCGW